jgi:predicted ATP-binding protein involved in virulence
MENFRGFKKASVDFPEGNVAVFFGWNGAGKTAVLDAVAIILFGFFKYKLGSEDDMFLDNDDIQIGKRMARVRADYVFLKKDGISEQVIENGKIPLGMGYPMKGLYDYTTDKTLPVISYYKTNRELKSTDLETFKNVKGRTFAYLKAINAGVNDFSDFIEWLRFEEDIENQQKIENRDFNWESPRLKTIRRGISAFLSNMEVDFTGLKVQRLVNGEMDFSKPSQRSELYIQKAGQELKLTQLSSGERSLILLVADIARRTAILNPQMDDPLQSEGVVLIDEIELHLHPRWQRAVIPALQATFPNIQFIIATHSPQVLSQVENGAVFEIDNFEIHPRDTYGRDNNWLLHVIMEDNERPKEIQDQLEHYFSLIRTGQLAGAARLRRTIEQKIGTDEPEFAKADVLLRKKERSLAP